ncbi:MAG TPA: ATP-binding cassette domain-containing protein [Mesorhizobium sp.]|uniref:ABC transporter ATP-binding protein n=1 Tax=Mesorhizobium sp. TaxID=1871066 RepID=UPI002DDD7C24|nr:ATP-binding cassette domain-containing protein [Mesorhizobium sp.]HEV2501824.1 ATP-binding cassette domain-containing protein [Mesorhizobium sp.]
MLQGVSLRVEPGSLVGLIGANGAGKSTLMNSICGFLRPRSGAVNMNGRDVIGLPPDELLSTGVGYLMEGHSTFPAMTVEENLALGCWQWRGDRKRVAKAVDEVFLRSPFLKERRLTAAGLMSGGQQRILEIERLYMTEPTLILLDEPSIGLSPKLSSELLARADGFRTAGAAVLLVDQNARRVAELADYVYVMQLGRIVTEGAANEIRKSIDDIVREFI